MKSTLLTEILACILGRKYYANIIATKGVATQEICSFIFRDKDEAKKHQQEIEETLSFVFIETISFRSHNILV